MAADQHQQRGFEHERLLRYRRTGQGARQPGAAAPEHIFRHAPAGLNDRGESGVGRGIAEDIAAAGDCSRRAGMSDRQAAAQRRQEIAGDRLPGLVRRLPVLPTATRDAALRREGRGDDRAAKPAALEAGRDLLGRAAAQQRINFLNDSAAPLRCSTQRYVSMRRSRVSVSSA
jgi:hypothetical protein